MHHISVFNITPCDGCEFLCGDLTRCWLSSSAYVPSWVCRCICAACFPLWFTLLLTFCLLPLLNLLFSPPSSNTFPPISPFLSPSPSSPRCSFPQFKDVFLVNTYYLASSSSLSPLSPLFLSVTVRGFANAFLHCAVESPFSCQYHLISFPFLGNNSH